MSAPAPELQLGEDAHASLSNQFLPFTVGQHNLALGLADVREIIRVPDLIEVPLSPSSLSGFANLRGTVLPVIDLRAALGLEAVDNTRASRVLVCGEGTSVGLRADAVHPVATVTPDQIDRLHPRDDDEPVLSTGLLRLGKDQELFSILDIEQLLKREFQALNKRSRRMPERVDLDISETGRSSVIPQRQLVGFRLGEEEFALPIEAVSEVVSVPDEITELTTPRPHVHGIITLRDSLLPLIDLVALLGFTPSKEMSKREIIVIQVAREDHTQLVGLIADAVNQVFSVETSKIDSAPDALASLGMARLLDGVCRLEDGARLIPLLALSKMLELIDLEDITYSNQEHSETEATMSQEVEAADAPLEVIVYQLDGEEYGVPIASVQEIIGIPERMTRLPKAPRYVEGVINLRGTVLPVIDMRARLDLPKREDGALRQILVLSVGDTPTGFVVDMVVEVLRAPTSAVRPALNVEGVASGMVDQVLSLEDQGRMIMLLSPDAIVAKPEDEEPGEAGSKANPLPASVA